MYFAICGGAVMKESSSSGCAASASALLLCPRSCRPGARSRRMAFICPTRCTTSNSRARPAMPYAFNDGETARQIVFSVRAASATTRFVFSGSSPRAAHSTDA